VGVKPGVVLVLLEQWTLTPGRDLRALVQMAVDAEAAGVETVMLSDHVLLTPQAGAAPVRPGSALLSRPSSTPSAIRSIPRRSSPHSIC
jgi:alkanesulfonate monooxygenase SsuD/methylene tetrahydromethanopterin reductase-like flavin-dependent oxidoreductase (luciferase family)